MSSSMPTGENTLAGASALFSFGVALGSAVVTSYTVYRNYHNRVITASTRNLERGAMNPPVHEISEASSEASTQEKSDAVANSLRMSIGKGFISYNQASPRVSQARNEYANATSKLFKMGESCGSLSINPAFPTRQRG